MFYLTQELEILYIYSILMNTVPFSQVHNAASTAPVESGQGGSCPRCPHASGAPGPESVILKVFTRIASFWFNPGWLRARAELQAGQPAHVIAITGEPEPS